VSLVGAIILLVGDSWAAGPAGAGLADALRAEGAQVIVDGVVGRSANLLAANMRSFLDEVAATRPTHVVFLLGVNDVVSQRTRDSYDALYAAVTSAGASAWILSNATLPDSSYRAKVLRIERTQREVFGTHALPGALLSDPSWFDHTGYHLTPEAAPSWVALVAPMLVRLIEGQSSPLARLGRSIVKLVPFGERWI